MQLHVQTPRQKISEKQRLKTINAHVKIKIELNYVISQLALLRGTLQHKRRKCHQYIIMTPFTHAIFDGDFLLVVYAFE